MRSASAGVRRRPFTVRPVALLGAALLGGSLFVAGTLPAEAHVRVQAANATAGGFGVLTFRVPNESDTAGTVKVAVTLPTDHPFLSVSTKPVPGWTVSAPEEKLPSPVDVDGTTITKAVRTITWTADKGSAIGPNEFQEFAVSVGPLPDSSAADPTVILLPATQTYSDGKVVKWNQVTPASGEEPDNPAPEFTVAPADTAAQGGSPSGTPGDPSAGAQPATRSEAATSSSDTTARVLGGLGLVLGAAALVVALLGRRRNGAA